MELTEEQRQRLAEALKAGYLDQLFENYHTWPHGPCYEGDYLVAKALQNVIGGDLYTLSGLWLVNNTQTDWHIFLKKEDYYWDHFGKHSQEDLTEFWADDNLRDVTVRPFQEKDFLTIGFDSQARFWEEAMEDCYSFKVRHGEEYDPLLKEVTRYFEIVLDPNMEMVNLCIRPCGTVCEESELVEFTHKSDDFAVVEMPIGLEPELAAEAYLTSIRLKRSLELETPDSDTMDIQF